MALSRLGHVVLKVRDLERSEAFYTEVVGLRVTGRLPGRMVFFTVPQNEEASHDFAIWRAGPEAAAPDPGAVGLLHVAWQVERPEDLEALYRHLQARGVPIRGTMDHGTNLSVYFEDPDGHTLEFTYERPREAWPAGRNPFQGRDPLPFDAARRG